MQGKRFPLLQANDDGKGSGGGAAGGGAGAGAGPGAGAGGAPATSWFGEAHKEYVTTKGFKTADDALTSLQNAEKLIGAERAGRTLIRPKDDKDAEGVKAWRAGIGVPEKPEDYKLPVPDGQSDGFAKIAAGWMHEIGIGKNEAVKITEKWNNHIAELVAQNDKALQDASAKELDGLKVKWGAEFDKNSEEARRFMKASGWTEDEVKRFESSMGTAFMLEKFQSLGSKLGEAGFVKGDGHGGGGMTKDQARAKIEEIKVQRANGQLSQADYLKQMDTLGPVAHAA